MPEDKPVAGEFTLFMAITPETSKWGTTPRMWTLPSGESKRHTGNENRMAVSITMTDSALNLPTPRFAPRSRAALMSQSLRVEPASYAHLLHLFGVTDLSERMALVRAIQATYSG